MTNRIRGTIAQLVAQGLTIEGQPVTAADISSMTRLGMAREDGEEQRTSGRGKAAKIWVIDPVVKLELHANLSNPVTA